MPDTEPVYVLILPFDLSFLFPFLSFGAFKEAGCTRCLLLSRFWLCLADGWHWQEVRQWGERKARQGMSLGWAVTSSHLTGFQGHCLHFKSLQGHLQAQALLW